MIPVNPATTRGGARVEESGGAAFTVLELLIVVGLIGVLSTLVLGVGRYARENGRNARAASELSALAAALESYRLARGDYPHTDQPARLLQALIGRRGPAGEPLSAGAVIDAGRFCLGTAGDPFLNDAAELLDPWGSPYRYAYKSEMPWSNPVYVLYSAGPDTLAAAALLAGGFPDRTAPGNADNVWASPP
jgi:type II secretory pathway pseudopilin PulG